MLDVVDGCGEDPLVNGREPAFHLFRIQAGELPGDSDHWNIDIRKDVRWGAHDYDRAGQHNQQCQNNKCIRTIESESNYPHIAVSLMIRHWREIVTRTAAAHLPLCRGKRRAKGDECLKR